MTQRNVDHLKWIHDRLEKVHGESIKVDYMVRFREIIDEVESYLYGYEPKKTAPLGGLPKNSLSEKDILMQEIQVLNETLYAASECADMKSTALVVEKLMILVNKLVPTE